jgi:hypothetical protein
MPLRRSRRTTDEKEFRRFRDFRIFGVIQDPGFIVVFTAASHRFARAFIDDARSQRLSVVIADDAKPHISLLSCAHVHECDIGP